MSVTRPHLPFLIEEIEELVEKLKNNNVEAEDDRFRIRAKDAGISEKRRCQNQGRSLFFYQGVQDNIFDKVFRGYVWE